MLVLQQSSASLDGTTWRPSDQQQMGGGRCLKTLCSNLLNELLIKELMILQDEQELSQIKMLECKLWDFCFSEISANPSRH